jgi:hypothetical protein
MLCTHTGIARARTVSFCRLTGGSHDNPSRYAFVEMETQTGAQRALLMNGQVVVDR